MLRNGYKERNPKTPNDLTHPVCFRYLRATNALVYAAELEPLSTLAVHDSSRAPTELTVVEIGRVLLALSTLIAAVSLFLITSVPGPSSTIILASLLTIHRTHRNYRHGRCSSVCRSISTGRTCCSSCHGTPPSCFHSAGRCCCWPGRSD